MPIHIRDASVWTQFPTTPAGTRLIWVRDNGQWKAASAVWARHEGAWYKEPDYVGLTNPPTNLRITSASNDYGGISFAWDPPSGGAPPQKYRVSLLDSGGGEISAAEVSAATLSHRFSTSQTTSYKVRVATEQIAGGGAWQYAGPLNWYVGRDSYVVYDVPIYAWGQDWYWTPNSTGTGGTVAAPIGGEVWVTSQGTSYGINGPNYQVIDNNNASSWISGARTSSSAMEAIRVNAPYWQLHRLIGIHVVFPAAVQAYWSAILGPTWQGGIADPMGTNYSGSTFRHTWIASTGPTTDWYQSGSVALVTNGDTAAGGTGHTVYWVDVLVGPNLPSGFTGYADRRGAVATIQLLLQNWYHASNGPRTVPADPSRTW